MGRPENPVPESHSACGRLARYLREGRRRQGLTYAALAACTKQFSAATLQRAASGRRVPSLRVVRAYAVACVLDVAEFSAALVALHEKSGAPPLRQMEKLARRRTGGGAVAGAGTSRSTFHRILLREALPVTSRALEAFLAACEIPERDVAA